MKNGFHSINEFAQKVIWVILDMVGRGGGRARGGAQHMVGVGGSCIWYRGGEAD